MGACKATSPARAPRSAPSPSEASSTELPALSLPLYDRRCRRNRCVALSSSKLRRLGTLLLPSTPSSTTGANTASPESRRLLPPGRGTGDVLLRCRSTCAVVSMAMGEPQERRRCDDLRSDEGCR